MAVGAHVVVEALVVAVLGDPYALLRWPGQARRLGGEGGDGGGEKEGEGSSASEHRHVSVVSSVATKAAEVAIGA
jgi:hypothetical protein